jgi:hypothetical protein
MPLGVWAKVEPRKPAADADGQDDLRDLIDGLDLPTEVAAISYADGCRIRRVRVPAAAAPKTRGARNSRPVILSKRALDEVRRNETHPDN